MSSPPKVRNLEHKLQRKLNQTRVAVRICGRHLSESVCVSPSKTRAGEAEVWVIKQIEELGAELETRSFRDRSSLEDREIKVVDAVGAQ
jgi:hypothetical protein